MNGADESHEALVANLAKLEADNAKLRANIVAAMALRDELRHDIEALTAENARLRAEVERLRARNEVLTQANGEMAPQLLDARRDLEKATQACDWLREESDNRAVAVGLLRARLALSEAVCEAVNEFWDTARDDDTLPFKVVRALEKWREGKG